MIVTPSFKLTNRPSFIALEGINGCGKTTLHKALSDKLSQAGRKIVDTREPGGTPLGKQLRDLLLNWQGEQKSPRAELLLFAADRAEHIDKVIRPSLAQGSWVICDRFLFSTIAFQGHGRGLDRTLIDQANALAVQNTLPDLVILLDIAPEEAFKRLAARTGSDPDAFEQEDLAFQTRIRDGFLACAKESHVPLLVLDATKTPQELLTLAATACGA